LEKLTYTHGRKGQYHTGSDNMKKGLPVDGQWDRVELYAERYSKKQDIYTGDPLIGEELEDWHVCHAKSKLGQHLSDYQKEKYKV
jgi:hypothetical protein